MSDITRKSKPALMVYAVPALFFALMVVFVIMLTRDGRDTSTLPSALIGQAAPITSMPPLTGINGPNGSALPGFDPAMFEGKITLMNVWASWCGPCRDEHPYLTALSKDPRVQLIGLNYKDENGNALGFLNDFGNPYDAVGVDINGRVGIEWGVYGVPETFLVGPDGVIRYKFTGPIYPEIIEKEFMPEIERLAAEL